MSDTPTAKDAARLLAHLAQARPGHHQEVPPEELTPELILLRTWQSNRLEKTYADLMGSKRFRPATQFFLSDIYGPQDFSQRNYDIERFYQGVSKVLPERAVSILADAVELAQMSDQLDLDMATVLLNDLDAREAITAEQYSEAYRILDNYDKRVRQIQLVGRIGRFRSISWSRFRLWACLASGPYQNPILAGWSELQGFLERGYAAFKHMKGAETFIQTIEQREMDILNAIFAGSPDPFTLPS
ncbi:MAG: hypothetical protein R3C44_18170 [Chloroflexota bacterium]